MTLARGRKGSRLVLAPFACRHYHPVMTDAADALMPASPDDLASALAFALRFEGRKRVHNAGKIMAEIVARRLVEHLERAGFVAMKGQAIGGGAPLGEGLRGDGDARAERRDFPPFAYRLLTELDKDTIVTYAKQTKPLK